MILKSLCVLVVMSVATLVSADDLTGVKCIVNGEKGASKDFAAKHLDGEVYFCCNGCKAKFEKDPDAYLTKANHQLALTSQYVQTGCPISGGPLAEGMTTEVGGTKVGFCCGNCLKKVDGAADLAAKADLVFTKAAFEKAYEKKAEISLKDIKCMMMPKKDVTEEQSVEYREGKVYFCCKGCAGKFGKDKEKFAVGANQQLVATGQFKQTGCPFSGGPVDEAHTVKINGVAVGFCCPNCKKKVEDAEDDAARAEMVFTDKAFEKGFAKK